MNYFDGLFLYEIVMLFAGILIFLVLIAALIVYLVKGKSLNTVLIAFIIPIVMIGFPAISSISLSKDKVELAKQIRQVQQNPKDLAARQQLEATTERIESRDVSSPETLTDLAQAQVMLNEPEKATANLDKALEANPQLPAAVELKRKIDLVNEVEKLTSEAEANPLDPKVKTQLNKNVAEVEKLPIASSHTLVTIGRAQEVLGKTAEAKTSADNAAAIDPNSIKAVEFQRRIDHKQSQRVEQK